jgi:DNA primase
MRLAKVLEIADAAGFTIVSREANGGGWIPMLCPFAPYLHERGVDRNPSFFIKVNNAGVSACHCFTCKEKGRISTILRKLEFHSGDSYSKLIIRADMEEIPEEFGEFEEVGATRERRKPVEEAIFFNMYPLAYEDRACAAYLRGRGISPTTATKLGLRFDDTEKRVLFPVKGRDGELYGYSGRAITDTGHSRHRDYGFTKELCLLGEHLFQPGKPAFVVEGLFAFAHLVEIGARGLCNPLASLGSTISGPQRDLLEDLDVPVYLCFDPDAAGDLGTYGKDGKGGAVAFLKEHVPLRIPLYPEGLEDIDAITLKQLQRMVTMDYETP